MITVRGIEFNDYKLAKITCEVLDELATLGFKPYKLTSVKLRKQQTKFGCCHTRTYKATKEIIENKISINRKLIETDEKSLRGVLTHEILHSLKECYNCGHDGEWLRCANIVNKHMGLNIKQYGTYEEYGIEEDNKKTFQAKCVDCGYVFSRKGYRAPKWVIHSERFFHTHVDGTKHKIIAIK